MRLSSFSGHAGTVTGTPSGNQRTGPGPASGCDRDCCPTIAHRPLPPGAPCPCPSYGPCMPGESLRARKLATALASAAHPGHASAALWGHDSAPGIPLAGEGDRRLLPKPRQAVRSRCKEHVRGSNMGGRDSAARLPSALPGCTGNLPCQRTQPHPLGHLLLLGTDPLKNSANASAAHAWFHSAVAASPSVWAQSAGSEGDRCSLPIPFRPSGASTARQQMPSSPSSLDGRLQIPSTVAPAARRGMHSGAQLASEAGQEDAEVTSNTREQPGTRINMAAGPLDELAAAMAEETARNCPDMPYNDNRFSTFLVSAVNSLPPGLGLSLVSRSLLEFYAVADPEKRRGLLRKVARDLRLSLDSPSEATRGSREAEGSGGSAVDEGATRAQGVAATLLTKLQPSTNDKTDSGGSCDATGLERSGIREHSAAVKGKRKVTEAPRKTRQLSTPLSQGLREEDTAVAVYPEDPQGPPLPPLHRDRSHEHEAAALEAAVSPRLLPESPTWQAEDRGEVGWIAAAEARERSPETGVWREARLGVELLGREAHLEVPRESSGHQEEGRDRELDAHSRAAMEACEPRSGNENAAEHTSSVAMRPEPCNSSSSSSRSRDSGSSSSSSSSVPSGTSSGQGGDWVWISTEGLPPAKALPLAGWAMEPRSPKTEQVLDSQGEVGKPLELEGTWQGKKGKLGWMPAASTSPDSAMLEDVGAVEAASLSAAESGAAVDLGTEAAPEQQGSGEVDLLGIDMTRRAGFGAGEERPSAGGGKLPGDKTPQGPSSQRKSNERLGPVLGWVNELKVAKEQLPHVVQQRGQQQLPALRPQNIPEQLSWSKWQKPHGGNGAQDSAEFSPVKAELSERKQREVQPTQVKLQLSPPPLEWDTGAAEKISRPSSDSAEGHEAKAALYLSQKFEYLEPLCTLARQFPSVFLESRRELLMQEGGLAGKGLAPAPDLQGILQAMDQTEERIAGEQAKAGERVLVEEREAGAAALDKLWHVEHEGVAAASGTREAATVEGKAPLVAGAGLIGNQEEKEEEEEGEEEEEEEEGKEEADPLLVTEETVLAEALEEEQDLQDSILSEDPVAPSLSALQWLDRPVTEVVTRPAKARRAMASHLHLLRDVLKQYPHTYLNYSTSAESVLEDGMVAAVGRIERVRILWVKSNKGCAEFMVRCEDKGTPSLTPQGREGGGTLGGPGYFLVSGQRFTAGFQARAILFRLLPEGDRLFVSGKVELLHRPPPGSREPFHFRLLGSTTHGVFKLDEHEWALQSGSPLPLYSSRKPFDPKEMRDLAHAVATRLPPGLEFLPRETQEEFRLMPLGRAVRGLHCPRTQAELRHARRRLVFDEFFRLQLSLLLRRREAQESFLALVARQRQLEDQQKSGGMEVGEQGEDSTQAELALHAREMEEMQRQYLAEREWSPLTQSVLRSLPFELTDAQMLSAREIMADLRRPVPMNRLLQGDVGCGKTVVAFLAMMEAFAMGFQAVIMAPTEFLAQQHFRKLQQLLEDCVPASERRPSVCLLTSSTKRPKALREALREGSVDLAVGTHSLISKGTDFCRLGLAVVDEQHRFGVEQRAVLQEKGRLALVLSEEERQKEAERGGSLPGVVSPVLTAPHVLGMSATPIPRTMALAMNGDMALSQINSHPPGRKRVRTEVFEDSEEQRARAYEIVVDEVLSGGRAFVVFPLIELSEYSPELRAATEEFPSLTAPGTGLLGDPRLRCGLVHGRMAQEEKQAAMAAFQSGETQVLLCTTVIEVGIDIPEASVMLVEHAERCGLAQLHQLRGRVGRGERPSMCLLIGSTQAALSRLKLLETRQDGFELAELDLQLRGPGELLGKKQSGYLPAFVLADLRKDADIMNDARTAAESMVDRWHTLPAEEKKLLLYELAHGAPSSVHGQ